MAKSSWDYFVEQKQRLEQERFRQELLDSVRLELMAFKDKLRQEIQQEIKREVYHEQQSQKIKVTIDTEQAARELKNALRF